MLRHVRKQCKDYNDVTLIPSTIHSHTTTSVPFEYPDMPFFESEENEARKKKEFSKRDMEGLLRDVFMLNYQEYYVFQQKFYSPSISLEKLGKSLGTSKQRVSKLIQSIKKKSPVLYNIIVRDKTHIESSKNSYRNRVDEEVFLQQELSL